MYQPPHHREDRREVQHALIRTIRGLLISSGEGGLLANRSLRLVNTDLGMGTLRRIWREPIRNGRRCRRCGGSNRLPGARSLHHPVLVRDEARDRKVVPTWNYALSRCGARSGDRGQPWLRAQVNRLNDRHESRRMIPWAVDDAPGRLHHAQLKGIVGIEVQITPSKASGGQPERNEADPAALPKVSTRRQVTRRGNGRHGARMGRPLSAHT